METSRFSFKLPPELIAQIPAKHRDESRLMVVNRNSSELVHSSVKRLPQLISEGSVMVLNKSKVVPARLQGLDSEGRLVQFLLLEYVNQGFEWHVLTPNAKRFSSGTSFMFPGNVQGVLVNTGPGHGLRLTFDSQITFDYLERHGKIPLPPYINREAVDVDKERYQTVYAREAGSVAAPTAGLHFTEKLIQELRDAGIIIVFITLHVGIGTFLPIRSARVENHQMQSEKYYIPDKTVRAVESAKLEDRPVIAVGTTVVRSLESAWNGKRLRSGPGISDLFIYPGFNFKVINQLFTNFHTPQSSLLLLVSAFAGHALIKDAYSSAIDKSYRFYSYGDAMLIC